MLKNHELPKDLAGEYRWGDIGQIILLIIFFIGVISDLLLLKISDSWQNILSWYFRIAIFILILFIACYFVQRSHKIVFQNERDRIILIKTDVFNIIRHPMYFGSILIYLGFVVLSFSVIALLVFVFIVIFYFYIGRYEEQILIEKLGDQYRNYMKIVPMFIPRIREK